MIIILKKCQFIFIVILINPLALLSFDYKFIKIWLLFYSQGETESAFSSTLIVICQAQDRHMIPLITQYVIPTYLLDTARYLACIARSASLRRPDRPIFSYLEPHRPPSIISPTAP